MLYLCYVGETKKPEVSRFFVQRESSYSYFLEVDELGFVRVEVEAAAVVAHRVSTDGGRRVFELLGDIFDDRLAVHAQEGATHLQKNQQKDNVIEEQPNCNHVALLLLFGAWWRSYQFRVDWVCPHHLPTDPHQGADAHG